MKRWIVSLVVLGGLLGLAACAAQEKEAAKPAPAAPEAKPAWQEEWERVLAAAKREGTVAMAGPLGSEARRALTEGFQRKYGITVEYLGHGGVEFAPRLKAEREAGRYLWDIYMGGIGTPVLIMKRQGFVEPMEPAFILPEVKEAKNWLGGKHPFADKDRTTLLTASSTSEAFLVNTNLVKPEDFKSYRDLLDPRWKGKITIQEPRTGGSGRAIFTFFYMSKDLGPDFIRALARQEPILVRDYRQHLEFVATGSRTIAIGGHESIVGGLKKAGAPIKEVPSGQMREGGRVGTGLGGLALISKAPHPNAAKVYLNWLLSREGAAAVNRATGRASTRADAPPSQVEPWEVPKEGYFNVDLEEVRALEQTTITDFIKEVFGR